MKNLDDVRGTKAARVILAKNGIDLARADVRVEKGRCSIRGMITVLKGYERQIPDVEQEIFRLVNVLKQKPEIRDVTIEATFRNPST